MDQPDTFPADFLWGAVSAAHQVEGGNVNSDLWHAEWQPGSIFVEPSGDACDSYHRYGEDIDLLADAGLNTYRFSVEWARIEPEEGYFSRAAMDHYRRMISKCLERGVVPMVTYQHFTAPRWFAERGGWSAAGSADLFGRYVEKVSAHIGDLVPWVCTINEANLLAVLSTAGILPAGSGRATHSESLPAAFRGGMPFPDVEVMSAAHRRAVDAVRSGPGNAHVGWTLSMVDYQAEPGGEAHCERARQASQLDWLAACDGDDFVGVQTYTRSRFGPDGRLPVAEDSLKCQMGWEIYPEALGRMVTLASDRTGLPVVVTENGIATADDGERVAYIDRVLRGVRECIDRGVDVRGYLHWSLLDNFEWMDGYRPTFGLVSVDTTDFVRSPKPSLKWLGDIARTGQLPQANRD